MKRRRNGSGTRNGPAFVSSNAGRQRKRRGFHQEDPSVSKIINRQKNAATKRRWTIPWARIFQVGLEIWDRFDKFMRSRDGSV